MKRVTVATPEQLRRIVWNVMERIRISGGRVVAVRPRPMTAAVFAVLVHSRGPDRGLSRNIEHSPRSLSRASRTWPTSRMALAMVFVGDVTGPRARVCPGVAALRWDGRGTRLG